MAGAFLSLCHVVPNRYPLARDVEWYIADEQRLGRLLDYAVIVPWLQRLYEWSAEELGERRLLELVRDGSPIYAWPYEERHVWRSRSMPFAGRVLERVTRPADAAGPQAGQLLGELENRQLLCEPAARASGGDSRASSGPAPLVSMTSDGRTVKVRPARITCPPPARRLRSHPTPGRRAAR